MSKIIGIDLGTTNSAVAVLEGQEAKIIVGAHTMSRMTGVPTYIAEVIQGMALMVMLIFLLFTEYKISRVRKK